jgi:hypothetical protein
MEGPDRRPERGLAELGDEHRVECALDIASLQFTGAPGVGLEPTTYGLTVRRSAKLSYPGTRWVARAYQRSISSPSRGRLPPHAARQRIG